MNDYDAIIARHNAKHAVKLARMLLQTEAELREARERMPEVQEQAAERWEERHRFKRQQARLQMLDAQRRAKRS